MTPEQIQRAKSIVEYAAVESLETEEIVLLGWAIQAIAARDAEIAGLKLRLGALAEMVTECVDAPPIKNCSCHISPPCNDCIENTGLRELFDDVHAIIAERTKS